MVYVHSHTPTHTYTTWRFSAIIQRSVWTRSQFTCLSLASVNTRERKRIHTAISNSKSMKHSMCFLPGGAETRQHSDHGQWRYAITGGPRRELSYSSCMYETNTVPIIRSQASILMWFISKARLCSSQPGKRERESERESEREINTLLTSRRRLGNSQSGATPVEQSKVGLTTSHPESPSAALFIKSCKRGQQQQNPSRDSGKLIVEYITKESKQKTQPLKEKQQCFDWQ